MSPNFEHVLHAVVLGVVLYLGMIYLLKDDKEKACSRSVLFAGIALVYMIMFGHNFPPKSLNPSLDFKF